MMLAAWKVNVMLHDIQQSVFIKTQKHLPTIPFSHVFFPFHYHLSQWAGNYDHDDVYHGDDYGYVDIFH